MEEPNQKPKNNVYCHGDSLLRTSSMIVNVVSSTNFNDLSPQNSTEEVNTENVTSSSYIPSDPSQQRTSTSK